MVSKNLSSALVHLLSVEEMGDIWEIAFDFLGITSCNADDFASFSEEVWIKLKIQSDFDEWAMCYIGLSICEIFSGTYKALFQTKGDFSKMKTQRQKNAVECLQSFMKNLEEGGDHFKCLQKLQNLEKSKNDINGKHFEASIQAVLACHLISPLLTDGIVIADQTCYISSSNNTNPECPFCKKSLKTGNTNFGCKELWHGPADIVIKRNDFQQIAKVTNDCEDYSEEEDDQGEPLGKRLRVEGDQDYSCNLVEDKTVFEGPLSVFLSEKPYKEAISQTIVNAFLAVRKCERLEDYLVPSFFFTQKSVFINFYNVKRDILLAQSLPMYFFMGKKGVNYAAFLSVWMALNFNEFNSETEISDKVYQSAKKSGFSQYLAENGLLEKYQNEVECEFSGLQKLKTDESEIKHIVHPRKMTELAEYFRK